jgi:hypothetical protein
MLKTRPPFVYIATTPELWPSKIGVAKELTLRLHHLQTGCWVKLHMHTAFRSIAAYAIENEVKNSLTNRLQGEWFDITALDMERILKIIVKETKRHGYIPLRLNKDNNRLPKT